MKRKDLWGAAVALFVISLAATAPALAGEGVWSRPRVLDKGCHAGRIACLGHEVHIIWIKADRLYWSHAREGVDFAEPVVISTNVEGVWTDLAADGTGLHAAWSAPWNLGYRHFDGRSWGPEQSVFSGRQSLAPGAVAASAGRVCVFYHAWETGTLPHTPGSKPMMMTVGSGGRWSGPRKVPGAGNVVQMDAATGPDGSVLVAWIQDEMGFLGRQFGLASQDSPRSVRASAYHPGRDSFKGAEKIADLDKGVSREARITAGAGKRAAVLWMNGYSDRRFGFRRGNDGDWEKPVWIDTNPADDRTLSGDVTADRRGRVVAVVSAEDRVSRPRIILEPGTPGQKSWTPEKRLSMGTDVRATVSETGTVHFVSTLHSVIAFSFTPPR